MSNAISLPFFLKKPVFLSERTLFGIRSYAGPVTSGVRPFHFSPLHFDTILCGGEGVITGGTHYNLGAEQLSLLYCDSILTANLFQSLQKYAALDMQDMKSLRNHSGKHGDRWCTQCGGGQGSRSTVSCEPVTALTVETLKKC